MSSVGRAIGEAMHNPTAEPERERTPEEKAAEEAKAAAARTERVRMLVENLAYKLDLYALDEDLVGRMDRWRGRCKLETEELKNERFGSEILKVKANRLVIMLLTAGCGVRLQNQSHDPSSPIRVLLG